MTPPWQIWSDPILRWLGQTPEVALDAQRFLRLLLPGIPFFIVYACGQSFLLAQNAITPCAVVEIIGRRTRLAAPRVTLTLPHPARYTPSRRAARGT